MSYNEDLYTNEKIDKVINYAPTKAERRARRQVYERYTAMRDDGLRKEAESDWEEADKKFRMYVPEIDPDDWRSHLVLPDAFSAIQADMQEKIDRKSRPILREVEDSDQGKADFGNAIITYNMDRTNYDYQYFLAKYAAAIRGTAFLFDYWRVDEREVEDVTGVNEDGTLKYEKKKITDFDDDYMEWIENEYIFVDPAADHIDKAQDCVRREILDVDNFKRIYGMRADFKHVEKVCAGGDLSRTAFFRMPQDMEKNEVEVLHYYNRNLDMYYVLANNVLVRLGPIPFKHKELPLAVVYHYRVPGRFYGMGIPKVIHSLSEERSSLRNLNMDRQKMHLNKMFLVDDRIDIDDEEGVVRPHGFIEVNTGGQPVNSVIQPLEYGDVPASYFRTEEILLEDIRRAHGIDDRIQGVNVGGTATEAAILKESAMKRVNMIASLAEMDTVRRIGRLKWSNIQFFYPAPRVERITEDNIEREKKVYRKITVEGQQFTVVEDDNGKHLKINEIEGSTTFSLDPKMATYMQGDFDITVDAEAHAIISKPIQQAKMVELLTLIAGQPEWMQEIEPTKGLKRVFDLFDENPKNWLKGEVKDRGKAMLEAEWENELMSRGVNITPTQDAIEDHTLVHLNFTETVTFQQLPEEYKAIVMHHIAGEHDANPTTGSFTDAMSGADSLAGATASGGAGLPTPGGPSVATADLTPSTVTGEEENNNGQSQEIAL